MEGLTREGEIASFYSLNNLIKALKCWHWIQGWQEVFDQAESRLVVEGRGKSGDGGCKRDDGYVFRRRRT